MAEPRTVLDLGSGAGADVLISARRVGPAGRAIGLDMTDEMLALARANAAAAGADNVAFVKGHIEDIPLDDNSVDVVISNCVINLSADKPRVIREAARVLKPGGRLAVSDVVADPDMAEATRADMQQWTGCVAGALTEREFEDALTAAGLVDRDPPHPPRPRPRRIRDRARAQACPRGGAAVVSTASRGARMPDRDLRPWGGDVQMPPFIRRILRRPTHPGDTPERRHEARQPQYPAVSVAENADRAIFGGWSEGHPGNRRHPGG